MACSAGFAVLFAFVLLQSCYGVTNLYLGLPCGDLVAYDVTTGGPQITQHYRLGKSGIEVVFGKQETIIMNADGTFTLEKSGILANFSGRLRRYKSIVLSTGVDYKITDGIRKGEFTYTLSAAPAQFLIPAVPANVPTTFLTKGAIATDPAPYSGYVGNLEMIVSDYTAKSSSAGAAFTPSPYFLFLGNGIFFHWDAAITTAATISSFYIRYNDKMVDWATYQATTTAYTLFRPHWDCCCRENYRRRHHGDGSDCHEGSYSHESNCPNRRHSCDSSDSHDRCHERDCHGRDHCHNMECRDKHCRENDCRDKKCHKKDCRDKKCHEKELCHDKCHERDCHGRDHCHKKDCRDRHCRKKDCRDKKCHEKDCHNKKCRGRDSHSGHWREKDCHDKKPHKKELCHEKWDDKRECGVVVPQIVCVTKTEMECCTKVVTVLDPPQHHRVEVKEIFHIQSQQHHEPRRTRRYRRTSSCSSMSASDYCSPDDAMEEKKNHHQRQMKPNRKTKINCSYSGVSSVGLNSMLFVAVLIAFLQ